VGKPTVEADQGGMELMKIRTVILPYPMAKYRHTI